MLWILLLAAALVALGVVLYNRLVALRNASESAWSDIDVQLTRRHDLVPNLVELVKGYAAYERKTLQEVTDARTRALSASARGDRSDAESALGRAIGHLFAVAEAYPELRASENFGALQAELAAVEQAIQDARRYYNAIVRDLNTACDAFPSNLVAGAFGIGKDEYFELESPDVRRAPRVDLGG